MNKHLLAALAALTLAAPIAAQAQSNPSEDVHGRVVAFNGAYALSVRDERGFIDSIQLHQGTIINPTGLRLAPGMIVNVLGFNAGGYIAADEIDTPYTFYGGVPYFQGHVWSYWGPTVSLGFFFGNVGWWHGGYFGGPYAWRGGVRIYNNVSYTNIYRSNVYRTNVYRTNVYRGNPRPHPVAHNGSLAARGHRIPENPIPIGHGPRPAYAGHFAGDARQRTSVAHPAYHQASAPARSSRPAEGHERR